MLSKSSPPNPLAMNPPRISPSVAQKAQSIMNGNPVITHKSMFAALNLGLADLEAMTERLEQGTTKQREFLCSRCKTPDPQSPGHHDHPIDNFSRPKSLPASSARHAGPIQHGGYDCPQPPFECFELPGDDPPPPQYHAIPYRASEDTPRSFSFAQRSPAAYRPQPSHSQTQPLDQRDWTPKTPNHADQSSRDSMFNVPSGYIFRRRNKSTTAPETNASKTPAAAANIPLPPPPPQQEMHLISDAVKLIKAKERQRRRKSVIDFLKKL
jgi:hypothetical protein